MSTMFHAAVGPSVIGVTSSGGDTGVTVTFGDPGLEQGNIDPLAIPMELQFGEDGSPMLVLPSLETVNLQIHCNENFFIMLRKLVVMIWFHAKRAFMWNMVHVKCTEYEAKSMEYQDDETQSMMPTRLQKYIVWRRSVMIVALPAIGIRNILALVVLFKTSLHEYYNSFGIMLLVGYYFGLILDGASICASLWFWNSYEKSSRFLAIGWIGSLVLSLWLIVVPVSFIMKDNLLDQGITESEMYLRWAYGMGFIIAVFPILITVPMSMIRGSLYIKGLLPEASLSGFFITLVSPSASILVVVTAVLISELTGDALSFIGVLLQILAPAIMAVRPRLYTVPRTDKIDNEISWIQWTTEAMVNLGLLCLVIWANNEKILSNGTEVTRFLFEWCGRTLITTVFFADRLFAVSICQLFSNRKAMGGVGWSEIKALMKHYNAKYSDFTSTEHEMLHLKDNTERDESND